MARIRGQPRSILVAQTVVVPLAVAIFGGLGAWLMARGETGAGWVFFLVAATGPLSIGVFHGLSRIARRRAAFETVVLSVAPSTALEWVTDAFRVLAPGHPPVVDREALSVSTNLPVNWKTGGESIVATVATSDAGSIVKVSSSSQRDQLYDFGQNRGNIKRVIQLLREHDPESE
jgi:hypothetical protein